MMNLKEAFRYQNKLAALMNEGSRILEDEEAVTTVKNTVLRHKVDPSASDETTIEENPQAEYAGRITLLVTFMVFLLEQRTFLSGAIRRAKAELPMDMDSEVSLNAVRRDLAATLRGMNSHRSGEVLQPGRGLGYRFNAEGNQVSYRCDIRRVTTINFDRNTVKSSMDRLNRQADEASTRIDLCLVTSQVNFEPPFDVNADFSEAFEAYLAAIG